VLLTTPSSGRVATLVMVPLLSFRSGNHRTVVHVTFAVWRVHKGRRIAQMHDLFLVHSA
jgi:hypothetical protein